MKRNSEAEPAQAVVFTRAGVLLGMRRFAPLALSVFAYGMVFGVLARQAGLSLGAAAGMSAFVSAGSSQLVAIGMWQTPLPVVSIVFTTLVVNLRHVLMGAALRPYLGSISKARLFPMLHLMGDESWAMAMQEFEQGRRDLGFMLGCGLLGLTAWVGSTMAGHLAASAIPDPAEFGLDFAFTAVFLALLVGMWKGRSSLLPVAGAVVLSLLASQVLGGKWYIVVGGLAGSLLGAWQDAD